MEEVEHLEEVPSDDGDERIQELEPNHDFQMFCPNFYHWMVEVVEEDHLNITERNIKNKKKNTSSNHLGWKQETTKQEN